MCNIGKVLSYTEAAPEIIKIKGVDRGEYWRASQRGRSRSYRRTRDGAGYRAVRAGSGARKGSRMTKANPTAQKVDEIDTIELLKILAKTAVPSGYSIKYMEPSYGPEIACDQCQGATRLGIGLTDNIEDMSFGWCGGENCYITITGEMEEKARKAAMEDIKARYFSDTPAEAASSDLTGAMRMFRIWKFRAGKLVALTNDYVWRPGVNKALGEIGPGGSGGFYGFNELSELVAQENAQYQSGIKGQDYIIGTILSFGRIAVATKGGRTEFAVPEYLVLSEDMDTNLEMLGVVETYGMKVISVDQAEQLKGGMVPYRLEMPE